ncbi:MAG: Biopolymer transport protein ExbD/TolR [Planctomycetaceae bacterium]|nr:Biopolymer transport protein ExbD/TolR [Planctomycetaceae bacterium]
MKIPTQARNSGLQFNLTPMIDIVFLLIIFFLVASYLSSSENQEAIQLAKAGGGRYDAEESSRRIIVTIDAEGKLLVGTKFLTLEEFAAQIQPAANEKPIRDLEIRLRADKRVRYEKVEPLLVECAKAGITQIKFNVLPGNDK